MLAAKNRPDEITDCKPLASGTWDEDPPRRMEPFTPLRAALFSSSAHLQGVFSFMRNSC